MSLVESKDVVDNINSIECARWDDSEGDFFATLLWLNREDKVEVFKGSIPYIGSSVG